MSLPESIASRLTIPAICAPMFMVSTPELVREACLAGVIGGLPRQNARSLEQFESWLSDIRGAIDRYQGETGRARTAPIAVNMASNLSATEFAENLDLCRKYGVEIIINATGNPTELTQRAHDHGMLVYADAVNMRFAEKAIAAGVDGITVIGAGGGGHSGTLSHLAFVGAVRKVFNGTIIMAGAVTNGATIRVAEILGADLAYLGTRFIASRESGAAPDYKAMLVSQGMSDLIYTPAIAGVPANWLAASIDAVGLDRDKLPVREAGGYGYDHLPDHVRPWHNLWSAGQGIELIDDVPAVAELVKRLREEYDVACATPRFASA
ncbi:MAG: NAD(P)H-dependent flavin oxidoreductase [Sphingobium sp.]